LEDFAAQSLARSPFFGRFDEALHRRLVTGALLEKVRPDTALLREQNAEPYVYFLLDGEVSLSRGGVPTGWQGADLLGAGALLGESAEHDAVTTVPSLLLKWETKDLARRLDEAGGLSDLARSRSVRALAEKPFRQSSLHPLPEQA